jgi:3-phenylpropionate/trans-cinnamate dioxygenase ferredoxin subunit
MLTQPDSGRTANLVKIASVTDLQPGKAAVFTAGSRRIALFNVEGTFYAIGETCTHWAGPLVEGEIRGTQVICPWHGAAFDLKTGAALCSPAQKPVSCYAVVVEGNDVKVELPE